MNKTTKALLIPMAALAVTATGVSAFNSELLERAGLSESQIEAFEEAKELRQEGNKDGARDVLAEAGIDIDTMQSIRQVHHEEREVHTAAIDKAVEAEDYEAFLAAIEGSPLIDIITSEVDFSLFVKAHQLRAEASDIMTDLGFPEHAKHGMPGGHGMGPHHGWGEGSSE